MEMTNIICKAIEERIVIQFTYEGQQRIVEPFTLGVHKDTNNLVLSAYRVGGYSKSQNEPPWRLYKLKKISNLFLTNQEALQYRQGYNPNDSRMKMILCTFK